MIRRGLLIATLSVLPLGQIWAAERQPLPVSAHQAHGTSVNVIFDTDMYSDIDDMLALAEEAVHLLRRGAGGTA